MANGRAVLPTSTLHIGDTGSDQTGKPHVSLEIYPFAKVLFSLFAQLLRAEDTISRYGVFLGLKR